MPPLARTNSYADPDFTLRRQFNKQAFRPQQREIIVAALEGNDVFVQAATSFGKSLCFQIPAVIDNGITIVVSPLLSLMMNQVEVLKAAHVDARTLNSNTAPAEREHIYADLASGHPRTRLLYVTPELCSTAGFRRRLRVVHEQRELARVAVDEAHCISEWGHDFRRDFKRLSWFREAFPDVPIMCLTATATAAVRRDVLATLGLAAAAGGVQGERRDGHRPQGGGRGLKVFSMSPFRWNLHLEIRFTSDAADDRFDDFVGWLQGVYARRRDDGERSRELAAAGERVESVPGIIYTMSRGECEILAAALRQEGIGARPFHAKLAPATKEETLARWIRNEPGFDIIVATTAFGMGIDKENVRFVVHWRVPKSFEGYYQEAGRAGRDGNASACILYYSREDGNRVASMIAREGGKDGGEHRAGRLRSLQSLIDYCEDTTACRHATICKYFGQGEEGAEVETPACDFACDWHKDREDLEKRWRKGLAAEEYVSTQAEEGAYDGCWED